MADIGIYTTRKVLEHKQKDGMKTNDKECYWTFTTHADVRAGDKLWVACERRWLGYFLIHDTEDDGRGTVIFFHSETWHPFLSDARTPFQGFTYRVPLVIIGPRQLTNLLQNAIR